MITTHSLAEATLVSDETDDDVPPVPGLILTEVPLGPAELDPLSDPVPAPVPTELDDELDELELDDRPGRVAALALSFCARQGCWLSTMIVVPPLLPLTIDTLAPPPEVDVVVSAAAIVVAPVSSKVEITMVARMLAPSCCLSIRQQTADIAGSCASR